MKRIYLDYAASTPVDLAVLRAVEPYFSERFGNPGSLHAFGQDAITALDTSREAIAKALGAEFRQIIFTGSATEANNLALRGAVKRFSETARGTAARPRVIISAIEHESVLETALDLEHAGVEVVRIPVDAHGAVDAKKIKENLTEETALVSVMYAQNEIGSIQPIAEIAKLVREFRGKKIFPMFHTDAAQAFQWLDCDVDALGIDLMTLSSHKIYGPKGIGALYAQDIKNIAPIITGGGQEFGVRSGTENIPLIIGFAKATELAHAARAKESKRIAELRDRFWGGLKEIFPNAEMNGIVNGAANNSEKLPNILNVYFPGHDAQDLLTKFDLNGLAASAGSACRSRAVTSSYVIEALGYPKDRARSSVRFSFGRPTSEGDIHAALKIIKETLERAAS